MITRKEYAEKKNISEKTVKNHMDAVGLDTRKAVLDDADVAILDYMQARLRAGAKMAEVIEEVKQQKAQSPPPLEQPPPQEVLGFIRDDLIGGAVEAAIPHIPQWTVEALYSRRSEIRAAFQRFFLSSSLPAQSLSTAAPATDDSQATVDVQLLPPSPSVDPPTE